MKKRVINKNTFILLFASYVIFILVSQQIQQYKLNKVVEANNAKIIQQEKETENLLKLKESYQTDEYIEKVAREKLGYVKPGEKVYIDRSHQ